MFFDQVDKAKQEEINKKKEKFIQFLFTLNAEDKKKLAEAMSVLHSHDAEKKSEFSRDKLTNQNVYDRRTVFRLYSLNDEFKAFCKDEKQPHYEVWRAALKEGNCTGEEMTATDKSKSCTVVDQYLASYFYNSADLATDVDYQEVHLNAACLLGFFPALLQRLKSNAELLKKEETPSPQKAVATQQLFEDGKVLCKLYWCVGNLHVSRVYLNLGIHYANNGNLSAGSDLMNKSIECFLWAKELCKYNDLAENEKAIQALCKEHSLKEFGDNWEVADKFMFKHFDKSSKAPNDPDPEVTLRTKVLNQARDVTRAKSPTPK